MTDTTITRPDEQDDTKPPCAECKSTDHSTNGHHEGTGTNSPNGHFEGTSVPTEQK